MSARTIFAAAALAMAGVLGVAGCASQQQAEKRDAGEFTDDAAVTAKVKSAIASDVGARAAAAIDVGTYRGTVQLSGFVDSKDVAERATKAASKVSGVKSLKNDLRVKSPS
jgi:hyperosmotically inducible periplasmic protein